MPLRLVKGLLYTFIDTLHTACYSSAIQTRLT